MTADSFRTLNVPNLDFRDVWLLDVACALVCLSRPTSNPTCVHYYSAVRPWRLQALRAGYVFTLYPVHSSRRCPQHSRCVLLAALHLYGYCYPCRLCVILCFSTDQYRTVSDFPMASARKISWSAHCQDIENLGIICHGDGRVSPCHQEASREVRKICTNR